MRHYKCAAHLQKTCEISGFPTDSAVDITLLCVRSTWIHTVHWKIRVFENGKSNFKYHAEIQPFCISPLHGMFTFLTTSLPLHYWHFQFILWYLSHSHLMNVVNIKRILVTSSYVNCTVTAILYRATCRLSDADTLYFQIRGSLFRYLCLMSVPRHKNIDTNIRLLKKWSGKFKENWS